MGKGLLSPVISQASSSPLMDLQDKKKRKKKKRRESQDAVSSGLSQEESLPEKASLEEGTPKKSKKKKKAKEVDMEHSSQMTPTIKALVSPPWHGDMQLHTPKTKKRKGDDDTPGRTKKNSVFGSETLKPKGTLMVKKQTTAANDMSQHPGDTSQKVKKQKALGYDMPQHPGDNPKKEKKPKALASEMPQHPVDSSHKAKKRKSVSMDMLQHPGDSAHTIKKQKTLSNNTPQLDVTPLKAKKQKNLINNTPQLDVTPLKAKKQKNLNNTPQLDVTPLTAKKQKNLNNTPQLDVTPLEAKKQKNLNTTPQLDFTLLKAKKQKNLNNNTPQLDVTPLKAKKQKTLPIARVRKKSTDDTENKMEDDSPADDEHSDDDDDINIKEKERGWSKEEKVALCDRILKQRPAKDLQSCRKVLLKFDWSSVANDTHSAEECKEKFMQIYTRLHTVKSLTTIAKEAIEFVEEERDIRKRLAPAMSLWMKDYLTPKRKAKLIAQGVGKKLIPTMAAIWKDLPQEKRDVYQQIRQEAKEKHVASTLRSKKARRKFARPYQMWVEQQKELPDASEKDLTRTTFNNLPDLDKIPYILTTLQQCLQHMKEKGEDIEDVGQEEGDKEGAEEGKKKKKADWEIHGPLKAELLIFLMNKDMPLLPPRHPSALLYHKLSSTGQLDTFTTSLAKQQHIKTQYQQLPQDKKDMYISKHKNSVEGYKAKLEAWYEHQDDVTRLAQRMYMGSSLPSYLQPQYKKSRQALLKNVFTNVTHNDMSCPKFHNEPQKPPATSFQVFALKFNRMTTDQFENQTEKNRVRRERWRHMELEHRKPYINHWEVLCQKYRSNILDYVANMDKKMRAVYLGFNRFRHYQYFKEDIYREAYPNSKYPVFALSPTKKHVSKVVIKAEEEDMGILHSDSSTSSEEDPSSSPAKDVPVSYSAHNNESSSSKSDEEEELIPHQGWSVVSHPHPEDDNNAKNNVVNFGSSNSSSSSEENDTINSGQDTSRFPAKATMASPLSLKDESSSSELDEEEEKANNSESSDSDSSHSSESSHSD